MAHGQVVSAAQLEGAAHASGVHHCQGGIAAHSGGLNVLPVVDLSKWGRAG